MATMATIPAAMCLLPIFLLVLSLIIPMGTLATTPAAMYLQPIFLLLFLLSSTTLGQAMGTPATTLAVTLTVAIATLHCLEGVTATMCVGGSKLTPAASQFAVVRIFAGTSASRTGCTRATGLQSAGPSATSSQSAWEGTGTVEAVTASSVDRMEGVEATGTTRATTQATTPDTTRDTIRYCLQSSPAP